MKLVIQMPCLDEAQTLGSAIADLPRTIPGVDDIAVLVIDDGSIDSTAEIAAALGAEVVRLPATRGLAAAFAAGIDRALGLDADLIVNTDGDHQYCGEGVAALVAPIVRGEADMVIGARPIDEMKEFSPAKRVMQRIGSWVVRRLSGADVPDATSGFRAYSREAAMQLEVFSRFTYTLETIVQGTQRGMRIASVPIRVNRVKRPSRLARGSLSYVCRAGLDLARMWVVYRPFRSFIIPALVAFALAIFLVARFVWLYVASGGMPGHVQSLLIAVILFGAGGALVVVALLGDLIAINRRMLEAMRLEARRRRHRRSSGLAANRGGARYDAPGDG